MTARGSTTESAQTGGNGLAAQIDATDRGLNLEDQFQFIDCIALIAKRRMADRQVIARYRKVTPRLRDCRPCEMGSGLTHLMARFSFARAFST